MLGGRTQVDIPVTIEEANGEIGFSSTMTVYVDEPDLIGYQVLLKLSREGTSGQANIRWALAGTNTSVTSSDTGPTSGVVVMEAGM